MRNHKLTLLGGPASELRVPIDLLLEVLGALAEGARQAARFAAEGESTRQGPRPGWLDIVSRFDVTGMTAGSAVFTIEAPTLREAAPDRFGADRQGLLFGLDELNGTDQTAVELFASVLEVAIEGDASQVMADRALLETCARFARVAGQRGAELLLEGLRHRDAPLRIRPEHLQRFEQLRDGTPEPQAVRVSGVLDTISATRSDVVIRLPDGSKLPARLAMHDVGTLRQYFDHPVVVSGVAHYRPSGKLLLLYVEELSAARESDSIFERVPIARSQLPVAPLVAQDETSGVGAFFGTWPGDESDGELLDALEAIE
jgi:hypothetical protein